MKLKLKSHNTRSSRWSLVLLMCIMPTFGMAQAEDRGRTELAMNTEHSVQQMARATEAPTAEEAVEIATREILALIRSGQEYAQDDPDRFYSEVEELLSPVVDFPRFARSVMGVWYKKATPEQRDKFAESFKWTLVRNYALALTAFYDGDVKILPNKQKAGKPNQSTVHMQITYKDKPYQVIYAMQRKKGKWQLVNIVIEGINLRLNYRSQFDSAMKGSEFGRDLERVIDAWTNVISEQDA